MEELYRVFGQRLRRMRQHSRLTQEQLGRRVGLSRTSITNMEKGMQHVSLHHLFDFAKALGVTPADLLPDDPLGTEETRLPSRIKGELRRLPQEDQAWVMKIVRKSTAERDGGDAKK